MAVHCDICGTSILSAQDNYNVFEVDSTFVSKCPYNETKKSFSDCCYNCWSTLNKETATAKAYLIDVTMRAINKIRGVTEEKDDLGGDPADPFGEPSPTCNECGELAYFIDYSGFAGEYETFWCKRHEKGHPLEGQ